MDRSIFEPGEAGVRVYRVEEVVPGEEPLPEIPFNAGFESGTDEDPDNWTRGGNQVPVRTSDDAHSGSFCIRAALVNVNSVPSEGSLNQRIGSVGGTIVAGESHDFSFWAKKVSSGPSYVQQYQLQWLDDAGSSLGGTGLKNFSGETGVWVQVEEANLIAPPGAVDARVRFRFVTGAVADGHGEVLIDDVSIGRDTGPVDPGETHLTSLVPTPAFRMSWPSVQGVPYQPKLSTDLVVWENMLPAINGDGGTKEFLVPAIEDVGFYRLEYPGPPVDPELEGEIVALYNTGTVLEPATTVDTPEALVTYFADRARDRHAREANFHSYDHYLPWYWEERTIELEIVDKVAKGGDEIVFNYKTLTPLGAAEFRAFFRGIGTVAEYHSNQIAELVGPNEYQAKLDVRLPDYKDLEIGDRVEIEISQFIEAATNGRNNYYGTTFLYIIGQGIVPWEGVTLPGGPPLDSYPLPEVAWLGGLTTLPYQYSNEPEHRFKQTAGNIAPISAQPFMLGRRLHHTDFGSGAHSESGNPVFADQVGKLGPHYIANSCVDCHVNNGRALPPVPGAPMLQTVMKVGADALGAPHPSMGSVLQVQAEGVPVEGGVTISSYTETAGQYGDGTAFSLRKPNYAFTGTVPQFFSARLASPLVGLGLLEAVSEATIMAMADPEDTNADGISGRYQTVIDPETGEKRLGRFTGKGGKARLKHQIAGALSTDMGVTTSVFPIPEGGSTPETPELGDDDLDKLTRYIALLGVGARRDLDSVQALQGEQLFSSAQCIKCHVPQLQTGPFHPMTELRNQTIRPYTDLLLHDMGPGLADNMGEDGASGSEWRTPPLWNIGLTDGVSGGEAYLHDGRARSLEEAILWHGGEAEGSKEAFRMMSAADREALIAFLRSL
ncbi:MAG: di-heme oxidoredictase family protein [Verrucomicrobiaceae bacterium]